MKWKQFGSVTAVVLAGFAAGGVSTASAAQPGEQCLVSGAPSNVYGAPIWHNPHMTFLYIANSGTWFRVEGYFSNQYYVGHSANAPSGLMERNVGHLNQASCRP